MHRKLLMTTIACIGLCVLSGMVIWSATRASKPPFPSAAAPAYNTLVLAMQRLADTNPSPPANDLAAYIRTNAPALEKLREALNQKFEAPESAYDNPAALGAGSYEIGSFKALALLLKSEGKFYEHQSKPLEAALSYTDIIRLGARVEAGPFLFALIGISIERIGIDALQGIEREIPRPAREEIASTLRKINAEREYRFEPSKIANVTSAVGILRLRYTICFFLAKSALPPQRHTTNTKPLSRRLMPWQTSSIQNKAARRKLSLGRI